MKFEVVQARSLKKNQIKTFPPSYKINCEKKNNLISPGKCSDLKYTLKGFRKEGDIRNNVHLLLMVIMELSIVAYNYYSRIIFLKVKRIYLL